MKPNLHKNLPTNNPLPIGLPFDANTSTISVDEASLQTVETPLTDADYEQDKPEEISEEAFKALPLCSKISLLSRQVCKACSQNKLIPMCFIGFGITKLYNILFSNFWLLFIASFIPTG